MLVERMSPEALAPEVGERIEDGRVGAAFGLDEEPKGGRVGGHLFVLVDGPGMLVAPDRVNAAIGDRRPGETAFVLARHEQGAWRYCGVGRWDDGSGAWVIPEVDHGTWKALGVGRTASRRLKDEYLERARVRRRHRRAVRGSVDRARWEALPDRRPLEQGGVRIDGGPGGFRERTVSLTDVAWVLVARDDVASTGGVLDGRASTGCATWRARRRSDALDRYGVGDLAHIRLSTRPKRRSDPPFPSSPCPPLITLRHFLRGERQQLDQARATAGAAAEYGSTLVTTGIVDVLKARARGSSKRLEVHVKDLINAQTIRPRAWTLLNRNRLSHAPGCRSVHLAFTSWCSRMSLVVNGADERTVSAVLHAALSHKTSVHFPL
jgi:hypothetical protein